MISQLGKPTTISEALTGRSSKWIADKFGVSRRTAQRWLKGTQQPKPDRRAAVLKSVDAKQRRKIAAEAIREARAVNAGRVAVKADTGRAAAREGTRNVGLVQLDSTAQARMGEAARALESGQLGRAEELFSNAVLNTNGRHYGPLQISDYPPGFHLF
jgi:hypothetical protein